MLASALIVKVFAIIAITQSNFTLRIGIGIAIQFLQFIAIGIAIRKYEDRLQACIGGQSSPVST